MRILLREARIVAAEEGRSISALLTDRLEAIVRERKAFDKARRRALARLREGLDLQWTPPSTPKICRMENGTEQCELRTR